MRVSCSTITEFLTCLEVETHIFKDTIRFSTIRRPIDGTNWNATKFEVVVQASVVVLADDESQYLLEAGQSCGADYEDADPERKGTQVASVLKERVEEFAKKRGWKVMPGVIGI